MRSFSVVLALFIVGCGTSAGVGTTGNVTPAGVTGTCSPSNTPTSPTTDSTGPTGAQGPVGPTGAAGVQGSAGPQGAPGVGSQGPQGPSGPAGQPGATGSQGVQGIQGLIGATGATGPAGTVTLAVHLYTVTNTFVCEPYTVSGVYTCTTTAICNTNDLPLLGSCGVGGALSGPTMTLIQQGSQLGYSCSVPSSASSTGDLIATAQCVKL